MCVINIQVKLIETDKVVGKAALTERNWSVECGGKERPF